MCIRDRRTEARRLRPTLEADPRLRAAAIATWRQRMINEYGSAPVFTALAGQLAEAGASAAEVDAVVEMAEEERRHGALCGACLLYTSSRPLSGHEPAYAKKS